MLLPGFEARRFTLPDVEIPAAIGGPPAAPPLLLLHGHPQTHVMWHRVAPRLADRLRVIATDLRGYGESTKPPGAPDHSNYSKRAMAADQVAVMRARGHERFRICAHDRGARVTHRLAMDHAGLAAFAPEAFAEYVRCARLPGTVHGWCEDYRAAAGIDLDHDREDRAAGRRIAAPLLALWGAHGVIQRCFDPLAEGRKVAADVRGKALPCGHYIAEEAPAALLAELDSFL